MILERGAIFIEEDLETDVQGRGWLHVGELWQASMLSTEHTMQQRWKLMNNGWIIMSVESGFRFTIQWA